MSTLNYKQMMADIERIMAAAPPPPRPGLLDIFRPRTFMGIDIYEEPPPPPKIQVRDIKLSDGTSLLSPKFLAETNSWFAAEFGYRAPLLKDNMALMWQGGVMVQPKHAVMIRNLGA